MISSPRGAVLLHWIVLGLVAALGLFFLLSTNLEIGRTVKGDWHLSFLQNYYAEAEIELLSEEQLAEANAKETILSLASRGGFVETSPCGTDKGINFWNNDNQLCFPKIIESLNTVFNTKSTKGKYSLSFEQGELIGTSERTIVVDFNSGLREKALRSLKPGEAECLQKQGFLPQFDLSGEVDSCSSCLPRGDCALYSSRFYCDVDPCNYSCVSAFVDDIYYGCEVCAKLESCEDYISEFYCTVDPCKKGCSWDITECTAASAPSKSSERDIITKITLAKFPDATGEKTSYRVPAHFRIFLGYEFDEYSQLQEEAVALLDSCRGNTLLQPCIESNRPSRWKFSSCTQEQFQENNGNVPFCVLSNFTLFDKEGKTIPVHYLLGLDFSYI